MNNVNRNLHGLIMLRFNYNKFRTMKNKSVLLLFLVVIVLLVENANCFITTTSFDDDPASLSSVLRKQRNRCSVIPLLSKNKLKMTISHSNDDDDISQYEFMDNTADGTATASKKMNTTNETMATTGNSSNNSTKPTGYRRIEDWHEDDVSKNPQHVLIRLQQEKAIWDKKFEDLGGDGI